MKRKYLIIIPILILLIISLFYLPNSLRIKQSIWIILGFLACIIISKIKYKKILKYSIIYYIICILLLVLVLLLNKFTNGSRAWLNFKLFTIQPSELMKIALILISIKYLNKCNIWQFILLYMIPMILIFLEPDTGGVIIDIIILIFFLTKKLNKKQIFHLSIIFTIIISLFMGIYLFDKEILIKLIGPSIFYRIDRITNFIQDDSIQTTNAIISIATGNTLYFPEMYNDFFIAYILSKNIYLLIIIILSTISLLIILKEKNTLASQVAFYLFLWQCWWNLAMNLKLVPVIGIPYLFLSYGGSHILSSMILIGIIISSEDSKAHNHKVLDNM
ncbi:MAG: FtsW/RodA/SpoVE family cell cycle protein [Bacilli bacterium]|nr:FtsW/RodA/SpoVE family cell cycle protein [Bacilli bacterium]